MFPLTFVLFDGLLLYGMIGVFGLLALISMEYDRPGICTAILAIALVVIEYYSTIHPISFVIQHPLDAAMLFGAYFVAGSLWIIIKWFSHVYKVRDRFNDVKQDCIDNLKQKGSGSWFNTDGSLNDEGQAQVYRSAANRIGETELPLQVSQHKADIYMWWLCWPLSLFWTLLSDPITRLWNFVYNLFGNMMQEISNNAFKFK
jgi:hypothetical protein